MRFEFHLDEKVGGFIVEVSEVAGEEITAMTVFEMTPELFDGIEFGGVGREPFEREPGEAFQQFADGGAFVHRTVVPDDDNFTGDLSEEFAEEAGDAGGIEGAVDESLKVQVATKGFRRDGQSGDGGDFFAGAGELAENGATASLRPGAAAEGRELNAGLVDQHHLGVFGGPFFTIAGHSVFDQAAMRDSSRCEARFAGFCKVNPFLSSQRQK